MLLARVDARGLDSIDLTLERSIEKLTAMLEVVLRVRILLLLLLNRLRAHHAHLRLCVACNETALMV